MPRGYKRNIRLAQAMDVLRTAMEEVEELYFDLAEKATPSDEEQLELRHRVGQLQIECKRALSLLID